MYQQPVPISPNIHQHQLTSPAIPHNGNNVVPTPTPIVSSNNSNNSSNNNNNPIVPSINLTNSNYRNESYPQPQIPQSNPSTQIQNPNAPVYVPGAGVNGGVAPTRFLPGHPGGAIFIPTSPLHMHHIAQGAGAAPSGANPIQIQIRYVPRPQGLDIELIDGKEELMTYIEKFADKDHYICSICTNILWEPTACGKCNKIYCLGCLAQWLEAQPNCPNCREQIQIQKCDPSVAGNIARLQFHCKNQPKSSSNSIQDSNEQSSDGQSNALTGCPEVILYDSVMKHQDCCQYQILGCVNSGCQYTSFRKDFSLHETTCSYQDVDCKWCCRKVKQYLKAEHENECEMRVVECINEGCEVRLPFVHLENHLRECPYTRVDCKHCGQEQIVSEIDVHQEFCDERICECSGCHNPFRLVDLRNHELICKEVQIQCSECTCILTRGELLENHSEIQCLQYGVKLLLQDQIQQDNKIAHLTNENNYLRKQIDSLQFNMGKYYGENVPPQVIPVNNAHHNHTHNRILAADPRPQSSKLVSSRYEMVPNFNRNNNQL